MPVKRTTMTCSGAAYKSALRALRIPQAMIEGELVAVVTKKAARKAVKKKKGAGKKR
jgi:hypothetical protein